ncbi:hypothetical protein AALP_AA2G238900 [Arabis alpina]|uniref:Uncharacterized protein n=1 Tax=Arabis alpina TaxID=50452 RepID=A0A087HJK5_ARAAL|nr:hypothetical protein AALP_AA2G238900 [Arabis alpina]
MISNMAADVSSIVRLLNSYKDDRTVTTGAKSTAALTTRDLLGNGGDDQSLELDLDLQVPNGFEKRLDLKSGKVYLQRCNSTSSSSITNQDQSNQTVPTFQDLNFPPPVTTKPLLNLFDDTSPELKLLPSSSRESRLNNFQSVCTLDKVKSALERAERDPIKKRQSPEGDTAETVGSPVVAGCSVCLSYVLVMKNNPKCPICDTVVSLPVNSMKKPKIDLNISI